MQKKLEQAVTEIGSVILGKERQVRLALCCLLAGGHLLIEDLPGMGKTMLSHALAKVLGLDYTRIQFTSDLLPADILGVSVFNKNSAQFEFVPGPVFTQVLLADEINRTTPKTQSALLEAMEERQVTVEGQTRELPSPFFVIATQNPTTQSGTYPLPESQLDRFLMRLTLGYPDREAERKLLLGENSHQLLANLQTVITVSELEAMQQLVETIHVSTSLVDYVQRLVEQSRTSGDYAWGLSPRGALALLRSAKTWALMEGRDHVLPEDVQAVLIPVVEHRLATSIEKHGGGVARKLLDSVDVIV
ncbi:AAA family ATPase [Solemya velum gill symbiont]|uniref:AAA family ATPase n=1 Tax=Solemya velum gill symbiont TaxID=2340 RepID=UPI00099659C8|nr:MoxR family ATPase [Solemya velum gill symbiont]OOZ13136.1 AAA family ATPase [Solemya velum gill symbiont]OOZ18096.1 AAA family ATPase [Solemya velum gill symbiont]OOZ21140.1 AAA family ATPase [Solemya velum gill symbiont]OOZ22496.1 AAA family ATPase [Solemya velum gill symbiont]OOZ27841.1 AAA family ATPase [Solemya velum gill symbiont]